MKTRNALVSNSSSASFICYWRCLNRIDNEPMTKEEAIKKLMREYSDENLMELTKDLIKYTVDTSAGGTFKTHAFTGMFNDIRDVPEYMTNLVFALKIEQGYELIDLHVDDDGG